VGIILKTKDEIERIRRSSLLVGNTLALVAANLKPGTTTAQLDALAERYILDQGARPAFKGYNGFPAALCISVNEEVVHGIPGPRAVQEGDIVSVDCGVALDGYIGDSAYTFALKGAAAETLKLLAVTRQCLAEGLAACKPGNRVGDIGAAVQARAEASGFSVVRELVGHGVGRSLHEKPEVPNYGRRGTGPALRPGLVLAIEPMINAGGRAVKTLADGWTVVAADRRPSAHFEHVAAVNETGCDVLSTFAAVEKAERANEYLDATYY
jgi:methionyl aminopeptidase